MALQSYKLEKQLVYFIKWTVDPELANIQEVLDILRQYGEATVIDVIVIEPLSKDSE